MNPYRLPQYLIFASIIAFSPAPVAQGGASATGRVGEALRTAGPADGLIVWVYLADKGNQELKKTPAPLDLVSKLSLERRARVRTADNLVDQTDFPIEQSYAELIAARVTAVRQYSKWFNAISVVATPAQVRSLLELPFVRNVDLVYRLGRRGNQPMPESQGVSPSPVMRKTDGINALNYGPSLAQVNLENIPAVHNTGNFAQGIIIGLFDNGFRLLSHQAFDSLRTRIIATYDFVDHKVDVAPNQPSSDFGGHGINTLSTIGGFFPGQVIGPAFGASFILARTENDSSETPVEEDNWVRAIEWADSIGVQVTSTSLGYLTYDLPYPSWTWQDMNGATTVITRAADMAVGKGIIVVNSAGNEAAAGTPNTLIAPADGDSVVAVGAVSPTGTRASFSSYGPTTDGRIKPDIMAVGTSIYAASAITPTGYTITQGTSFSCPLAAGVAALVLKAHPTATPMAIVNALKMTASLALNPNSQYGWGVIDAFAAIQYLNSTDSGGGSKPFSFVLEQNYPNPFNAGTVIVFRLPEQSQVTLQVFDVLGREIRTLVQGTLPASTSTPYRALWDGTRSSGDHVSSGVYCYRLAAKGVSGASSVQVRTMVVLK